MILTNRTGLFLVLLVMPIFSLAAELLLIDAHIHYSHDAWARTPPAEAVAILREAGIKKPWYRVPATRVRKNSMPLLPILLFPYCDPIENAVKQVNGCTTKASSTCWASG